ncbi:MAG: hypothetical protein ACK5VI_10820 [Opitutia bacterium]
MRYAELRKTDGAWRVWLAFDSDTPPSGDPDTVQFVEVSGADPAVYARYENGTYTEDGWTPPPPPPPVVPPPPTVMSRLAFQSRYTVTEQVGIELVADGTTTGFTPEQRATLRVLDRALQNATEVDLTDPRTTAGVGTHVALGLLTQARADEILDPHWSP